MTRRSVACGVTLCAALGLFASALAAEVTSLRIESTTGEPIGDVVPIFVGVDAARISAERNEVGWVKTRVNLQPPGLNYFLMFVPPAGASLLPGTYSGVGPYPLGNPDAPRMLISGAGCDSPSGAFEVLQAEYGGQSEVTAFWATFYVSCDPNQPGLEGEIRIAADVALWLQAPSRVTLKESHELALNVAAATAAGPVVLGAEMLPQGATFEDHGDATGILRWTPDGSQLGQHTIVLTAGDALGRTDRVLPRIQVTLPNDELADAIVIEDLPFSADPNLLGATSAPDDPSCMSGLPSVWYRLRMPRETRMEIRASQVGVFSDDPSALVQVTCGVGITQFTAAADTDYFIEIYPGPFLIDVVPPPPANDDFDNATPVTSLPFTDALDTRGATGAADDPFCSGQCQSVWYRYTPAETIDVLISSLGSDYDTDIFVYTGSRGALHFVSVLRGAYRITTEGGVTYHFAVTPRTYNPYGGQLVFSMTARPPLALAVSVQPLGSIDLNTRTIRVRGEVACSLPSRVFVGVTASRRRGRNVFSVGDVSVVDCSGRVAYEAVMPTYQNDFTQGPITVQVTARGYDPVTGEAAEAHSLIDVRVLLLPGPVDTRRHRWRSDRSW